VPVNVIRFHKGEPQALGRYAEAAEQCGGKATIATPKIQHAQRAVPQRHTMDMGQVGTDIRLCFRRMLLEEGICIADGPERLATGLTHTSHPQARRSCSGLLADAGRVQGECSLVSDGLPRHSH
jgi:hypothetical protein